MPTFFRVVKDGEVTVDEARQTKTVGNFKLPGLPDGTPSPPDPHGVILMFMLSGKPGSHLKMANKTATATHALLLNPSGKPNPNHHIFDLDDTYTEPQARYFLLGTNNFAAAGNELTITIDHPEAAQNIKVSDVVILSHD